MPKRARGAAGRGEEESTANEVARIVGVCHSVDLGPRLALLALILVEKQVPKVGTRTVALADSRFILGR